MKREKIYIAGIETFRITIELDNVTHDCIKVESWSKLESEKLALLIIDLLIIDTQNR